MITTNGGQRFTDTLQSFLIKKRKRKGKEMKTCNCCAKTNKELTILTDINEIEYEICYSCYSYDEEFEFWLKTF